MLLDAAVGRSLAGADALEENQIMVASDHLVRAQRIVVELRSVLDFEQGGEISINLDRIYEFAHWSLIESFKRRQPQLARNAARALTPIRDGWRESFLTGQPAATAVAG